MIYAEIVSICFTYGFGSGTLHVLQMKLASECNVKSADCSLSEDLVPRAESKVA